MRLLSAFRCQNSYLVSQAKASRNEAALAFEL